MQITKSAGGVVINPLGLVAITNQNGDSWSLPKGHIEVGERAEEAALRETYEETGILDAVIVAELGTFERPRIGKHGQGEDESVIRSIKIFIMKSATTGHLTPVDPANPEAKWVTLENAIEMLSHPKDKEFLRANTAKIIKYLHH